MRRLSVLGVIGAAFLLSACATEDPALRDGWDLIVSENYNDARAYYESLLAEEPDNAFAHLNLGVAYEELGETEKAVEHYQAALAIGREAEVGKVAEDGNVASRSTTVAKVAEENLAALGRS